MGETSMLSMEISPLDIEACLRVVKKVGANMNLFKLPELKPLRAALHPLILEQMKNYSDTKEGGSNKRNRKRKGGSRADLQGDLEKLSKQKLEAMEEEYINQVRLF